MLIKHKCSLRGLLLIRRRSCNICVCVFGHNNNVTLLRLSVELIIDLLEMWRF